MNINTAFPSKWLRANDLNGRDVEVRIARCVLETLGHDAQSEEKPVLYFQGKEKGLVLNVTNALRLEDAYGPETNDWTGKAVVLYTEKVQYQGKLTPAIRVRMPAPVVAPVPDEEPPF